MEPRKDERPEMPFERAEKAAGDKGPIMVKVTVTFEQIGKFFKWLKGGLKK